jgi:hypothetical protein
MLNRVPHAGQYPGAAGGFGTLKAGTVWKPHRSQYTGRYY